MVVVQVIKVGAEVRSYDVSDNPTLANVLNKANEQFVQNAITINARNIISPDTRLSDGDRVFIGSKVKGNVPYVVEFIRLGQGEVVRVSAEGDATISQCLDMLSSQNRAYFVGPDGKEVFQYQVNGSTRQASDIIPQPPAGQETVRVICAMKVKGN